MNIVWWLVIGLVAGVLARVLVPGRDPLGWGGTLILGLVGSLVGGLIGNMLTKGDQELSPAGLLGSVIGAIIALIIYRAVRRPGGRLA